MKNKKNILLLKDSVIPNTEIEYRLNQLIFQLESQNFNVRITTSYEDLNDIMILDKNWDCVLLSFPLARAQESLVQAITKIHHTQENLPCFLLCHDRESLLHLERSTLENIYEIIWVLQEEIYFLGERIEKAVKEYDDFLLPPLTKAMLSYNKIAEYSWSAPGHQGGVGFNKTALGQRFFNFYGDNMFLSDIGIERTSIGSLLDHTGAFHDSEQRVAKIFGSDLSYSVLVGTSGSNRTIMQAVLTEDDVALVDRNCHKSIEQGLINTGATPIYMIPSRNHYGIIGPILPLEMTPEKIAQKIQDSPLISKEDKKILPQYSVVTNCTYDGVVYNSAKVEGILEKSIPHMHFDEAWYGYARFHPVYKDHYAMRGDSKDYKGKSTIFATHSTHKLLNALSQSSYVHVRHGETPISEERYLQSYNMHATTSPYYPLAVSNEIGAVMMGGDSGYTLMKDTITEAVYFRQQVAKLYKEYQKNGEWFFKVWNNPKVTDPATNKIYDFEEAPVDLLVNEQSAWVLNPKDEWHGFKDLPENWAMLDPIKVSLLSPGISEKGEIQEQGVPAELLSYYFSKLGVVPTRTTDFQVMFLFSMGITEGKWGSLLNALVTFKEKYDHNEPLTKIFPELVVLAPDNYKNLGIKDLGDKILLFLRNNNPEHYLDMAYSSLPTPHRTPRDAYKQLIKDNVELVPLDELYGRVAANSIIPYPPGIPMIMSGENFGGKESPQIAYLKALEKWDLLFPGFEHETEGAVIKGGKYYILCIKE